MVYARVGCGEWRVGGGWGRGVASIFDPGKEFIVCQRSVIDDCI